jgi:hypothetical protein
MGTFRLKPATQFVERCNSFLNFTLNMEDFISYNFYEFKKGSNVF